MRLFGRNKVRTEGEKMPPTLDADCLGEKCPNWQGKPCESGFEWMSASATVTDKRDTNEPPFIDETEYVIYGQYCTSLGKRALVAQRVELIKPPDGGIMELMATTGMYGDMPIVISHAGETRSVVTVADSGTDPSSLE